MTRAVRILIALAAVAAFAYVAISRTLAADAATMRRPKNSTITVLSSPDITPARAKRLAATVWDALSQAEVDDVTARAKTAGKSSVRIFCFDESKCGDLASSLENAFESAHWQVVVRYTASMVPDGMEASAGVIKTLVAIDPGYGLSAFPDKEPTELITIGEKPQGRLE